MKVYENKEAEGIVSLMGKASFGFLSFTIDDK